MSRLRPTDLPGAAATEPLDEPVPGAEGRFRRVIRLSLPTGGAAETLEFMPGTSVGVRFLSRTFDALSAGAPVAATLVERGSDLVLRLPRAGSIGRIELASRQSGDELLAFRFDGETVAENPVASPSVGAQGARLDVSAAELILRRCRDGSEQALPTDEVTHVWLDAPVVLPRLSLALVGDPAGFRSLPPQTGPDGEPVFPAVFDRGPAIAEAIATAVARWQEAQGAPLLPDPVEIDLGLEADAPCSGSLTTLALDWRLGRASFADGPGKRVVRLSADGPAPAPIALDVPAASGFEAATMRVAVAASGGGAGGSARAGATGPAAMSGEGWRVPAGGALASALPLAAPTAVAAAGLAVGGVDGPCEVRIVGWSDAGGSPGTPLFTTAAVSVPAGAPRMRTARLPSPVVADAGRLWLGVEAVAGRAIVALAGGGQGVAARDRVAWSLPSPLAGRGAVVALVPPLEAPNAVKDAAPLALSLGGVPVPLAPDNGEWTANLAPALGADGQARTLALTLGGAGTAMVTLRAPVLRYRVGP